MKEEKLPPWTLCSSVMIRMYSHASRRRDPSAKSQPYLPVGWYCGRCDTFVTDAQYEERNKDSKEKQKMFNRCFFGGYRYNYNNKDDSEQQLRF